MTNENGKGLPFLSDFWDERYLKEYVADSGSKIKFVTGKNGSGKSFFLRDFENRARSDGYLTVFLNAKEVILYNFRDFYLSIINRLDLEMILRSCGDVIISGMGYKTEDIPSDRSFYDYLASKGEANVINMAGLRDHLKMLFLDNPLLDRGFAQVCALLSGGILGYPSLDEHKQQILLGYLRGNKEVKLSEVKNLGVSVNPLNKYNARHMLRSLCELIHSAGYKGLLISIDNLDYLSEKYGEEIRYTRGRRDDTYEIIRELIDDIDSMRYIMMIFAFDRILIDDEKNGLKSYQALWMRIQNEIRSDRFNCFTDIADLDELALQEYGYAYLRDMKDSFIREASDKGLPYENIDDQRLMEIKERSANALIGLPLLLKKAVLREETNDEQL